MFLTHRKKYLNRMIIFKFLWLWDWEGNYGQLIVFAGLQNTWPGSAFDWILKDEHSFQAQTTGQLNACIHVYHYSNWTIELNMLILCQFLSFEVICAFIFQMNFRQSAYAYTCCRPHGLNSHNCIWYLLCFLKGFPWMNFTEFNTQFKSGVVTQYWYYPSGHSFISSKSNRK